RPVRGRELAVAQPDRGGRVGRLERVAPDVVAALPDVVAEGEVFPQPRLRFGLRHLLPRGLVRVDQAQVFHGFLRIGTVRPRGVTCKAISWTRMVPET